MPDNVVTFVNGAFFRRLLLCLYVSQNGCRKIPHLCLRNKENHIQIAVKVLYTFASRKRFSGELLAKY